MEATTSIAIVGGGGRMGDALATRMAALPYRLLLIDKGEEKLKGLKEKWQPGSQPVKADCLECTVEACWEADIIVLAVPAETEKEIGTAIRQVAGQKIIISLSNPDLSAQANSLSAAEQLQAVAPFSKVIKAFNLSTPQEIVTGEEMINIAGNDPEAVATVVALLKELGFKAFAHYPLSECRDWERAGAIQENKHHLSSLIN